MLHGPYRCAFLTATPPLWEFSPNKGRKCLVDHLRWCHTRERLDWQVTILSEDISVVACQLEQQGDRVERQPRQREHKQQQQDQQQLRGLCEVSAPGSRVPGRPPSPRKSGDSSAWRGRVPCKVGSPRLH